MKILTFCFALLCSLSLTRRAKRLKAAGAGLCPMLGIIMSDGTVLRQPVKSQLPNSSFAREATLFRKASLLYFMNFSGRIILAYTNVLRIPRFAIHSVGTVLRQRVLALLIFSKYSTFVAFSGILYK